MQFSRFIALAASVATAAAQAKGFNYGSTNPDGSGRTQADYTNLFNTANNLVGGSGFTSARLYTMIDAGSANSPISAIPAAINTKTSLLLGLWASAGQANFNNELAALSSAISTYGSAFTDLVVGISVGSEDLYRDSVQGMANNAGIGAGPNVITSYISQVRTLIGSTILNGKPVGHVDTWNDYVNGSNAAVITACDFLGMDAYPYFETTQTNSIDNGKNLFYSAYDATVAVAQGKPVWVTETGWPVSGPTMNLATANVANSKTYWDQVGCSLFGTVNTWWYTIYDGTPSPSFGIVGSTLSTTPLFDLTCPAASASGGASSAAGTTLATSAVQTAPTQAVTAPATATQITTGASAPVSSLATAPGVEGGAGASQTQANSAPATTVVTSAAAGTSGVAVSQISDGQVQAPGPKTTTGAVVSQISDGQVQAPTGSKASASAPAQSGAATAIGSAAPSSTASGSTSKSCPAALTGTWEYPHLIIPVDKDQPSKAYGTQYFGTINNTVSTIFNFDIPASYAGKTCSLVFLFPTKDQLETSDFTYSGEGGIDVYELSSPATEQTTYSSAPSGMKVGSLPSVKPGNSYTVTSHECGAGQRVSFEFEATGSFALNYFQDYNPSPLGAYVVAC